MKSFNLGQLGHAGHIPDMSVLSAGHNQRDADKTGDHPPLGGCPLCPPLMPPKKSMSHVEEKIPIGQLRVLPSGCVLRGAPTPAFHTRRKNSNRSLAMSMIYRTRHDDEDLIGSAPIPEIVTTDELAELLGISTRNVNMLTNRGVLKKNASGRFDTRAALRDYCEYARRSRGNPALDAEKLRLTREQADKIELQNATARRELIPAAEVEREWTAVLRDIRAALLALPSRIGQRLPHLPPRDIEAIDREIRDVLTELAD